MFSTEGISILIFMGVVSLGMIFMGGWVERQRQQNTQSHRGGSNNPSHISTQETQPTNDDQLFLFTNCANQTKLVDSDKVKDSSTREPQTQMIA